MPEEDAPIAPVVTSAAPSAAPTAPAASGPGTIEETFFQRMERLGGFGDEATKDEATAPVVPDTVEQKAEAKAEKGKGKKEAKAEPRKTPEKPAEAAQDTPEQKIEQLKALAAELGMVIEDGKVLTSDRAALRIAKRDAEQRVKIQEQELVAHYNKHIAEISPRLDRADAVLRAIDDGEADDLAKLAGMKDWNEAQERFMAKLADPNWKRIKDLERTVKEKERQEEEQKEQLRKQSENNAQLERERNYRVSLSKEMKGSKEQIIASLAEVPAFVHTIWRIQKEHWDGSGTVTPEQALDLVPKGAQRTIRQELEQNARALQKAFGLTAAAAQTAAIAAAVEATPKSAEIKPDRPGARPRPKSQVAPAATAGAPSPAANMTQAERRAYRISRLKEAADEDRRAHTQ